MTSINLCESRSPAADVSHAAPERTYGATPLAGIVGRLAGERAEASDTVARTVRHLISELDGTVDYGKDQTSLGKEQL